MPASYTGPYTAEIAPLPPPPLPPPTDCFQALSVKPRLSGGTLLSDCRTVSGDTGCFPFFGTRVCRQGRHEWRVRAVSSTPGVGLAAIGIGVARSGSDAKTVWSESPGCWGLRLNCRDMCFAGQQWHSREVGPERFMLPCSVTVLLDCDAGTLSIAVGATDGDRQASELRTGEVVQAGLLGDQMPLTMVCPPGRDFSVPKNEELCFMCATYHGSHALELVSYKTVPPDTAAVSAPLPVPAPAPSPAPTPGGQVVPAAAFQAAGAALFMAANPSPHGDETPSLERRVQVCAPKEAPGFNPPPSQS